MPTRRPKRGSGRRNTGRKKIPEEPDIIIEDVNGVPVGEDGIPDVPQATGQDLMNLYTDAVNASAAGTDGYIFYGYENLTGGRNMHSMI